jgi:hypothetical protein
MGKYTALENPIVDRLIDGHLNQIVSAITDHTSPQSVILYGSPARGEASAMVVGDQVHMLSDYEIKMVGKSPRLRGLCATLAREMTTRLGISVGIGWMHPRRLQTNQSGNFRPGRGAPSIFMYELKSCGQTIYGHDLLSSSPPINPDDIPLRSGIVLVLNRMAESLNYLPCSDATTKGTHLERLVWINKIILSCAEALLLSARCYHFSYRERGRRFAAIAPDRFAPLVAKAPAMPYLVRRATEFKVRPDPNLYPGDLRVVWPEVAAMTDVVFRYLIEQQYDRNFDSYTEFPKIYLNLSRDRNRKETPLLRQLASQLGRRLVEGAKYLEQKRWLPPVFWSPNSSYHMVYALVPVLFQSCFSDERSELVGTARQGLGLLGQLEPPSPDPHGEWNYLRQVLAWNWKVFCY